jgi:1-pyrroline-5-carboxylate dehydrogenase
VTRAAAEHHAALVESARSEGFRVAESLTKGDGFFVPSVVVSGVPSSHHLATTEHFVPFLTVSEVADFDTALTVANATDMGLTAGIYTGDREEARSFLDGIEAGCVNVNVSGHATTGWWPGPQTFGGWKGSGSSGKHSLGKWYFQLFTRQQARKIPRELEILLAH